MFERVHAIPVAASAVSLDESRRDRGEAGALAVPTPVTGLDLWSCALARSDGEVRDLAQLLSPAESARAARFGNDLLRNRYIVGRATLRLLLGRRLAVDPVQVPIKQGARGRPYVADADGLDFNVAHTDGFALIGMTRDRRIGVDIEHADRQVNVDGVARKFMSGNEREALALLTPDGRRRALLRLWTCKEAMSKATGDALSAPFREIDIATNARHQLVAGPSPYSPGAWELHAMTLPGAYFATVALWQGGRLHG